MCVQDSFKEHIQCECVCVCFNTCRNASQLWAVGERGHVQSVSVRTELFVHGWGVYPGASTASTHDPVGTVHQCYARPPPSSPLPCSCLSGKLVHLLEKQVQMYLTVMNPIICTVLHCLWSCWYSMTTTEGRTAQSNKRKNIYGILRFSNN